MGDLSLNLSRHEMTCECGCGFDTVDIELVNIIQGLCDYLATNTKHSGIILEVTGPNRCYKRNEELRKLYHATEGLEGAKTSPRSQHQYGRAMDFKLYWKETKVQIAPSKIADRLESNFPNFYGIGRYHNRTHLDTRTNGPARW